MDVVKDNAPMLVDGFINPFSDWTIPLPQLSERLGYQAGPTAALKEAHHPPLLPVSWETINDDWFNYCKDHNPYNYFGIYDVVRFDTFWLDKERESAMLVRKRLRITGRVQGVAFRTSAVTAAQALGLSGWVTNRPDGSVEAVAEGDEAGMAVFIRWCHRGPPAARVDCVEVTDEPIHSALPESFAIR